MSDPTLHAAPAAALQLIGGGRADGQPLTKEQKRFNQLVGKIKAIRAKIDRMKQADEDLRHLGQKLLLPAEEAFTRALRDFVVAMHVSPHKDKLTRRQHEKFREVMHFEITLLLRTPFLAEDEALRKLFGFYSESGMSYEEMEAAAAEAFGADLDDEDLDEPEEPEESREDEPKERKKTKGQLEAESKREAAQKAVKKTTRQIYLDLVKHCHPDREQDELKRAEKTEWMKRITAAYDVDDHLRLLEMQMTLLAERENAFADFNDLELRYFNESLQQQFSTLEDELMMSHPLHTGNRFGRLFHPNRNIMLQELETEQSSLKHRTQAIARNAELMRSEQGFRRYVVDYPLPSRHDREGVDLADIFR